MRFFLVCLLLVFTYKLVLSFARQLNQVFYEHMDGLVSVILYELECVWEGLSPSSSLSIALFLRLLHRLHLNDEPPEEADWLEGLGNGASGCWSRTSRQPSSILISLWNGTPL